MDISNASIGKRIRELRTERGFTREQLAEYADISSDFLGVVEVGKCGMKVQNLAKLAAALNVTTDYLIYGAEPSTENAKIAAMLSTMTEEKQKQIFKLLGVFFDTVRAEEKKPDKKPKTKK